MLHAPYICFTDVHGNRLERLEVLEIVFGTSPGNMSMDEFDRDIQLFYLDQSIHQILPQGQSEILN